jgi:molybdopterin converting factor small subunit
VSEPPTDRLEDRPPAQVELVVPPDVRPHCGGRAAIGLAARDVRELLAAFAAAWPAAGRMVQDERGEPRRHLGLFVGTTPIRSLRGLDTPLRDGAVVSILQLVSGG